MSPRVGSSAQHTLVTLDERSGTVLHRQIYDALRGAILAGRLAPGARVTSARGLAEELGVGRNTVGAAMAQLRAEGYIESRERSGSFVATALPDVALSARGVRRGTGGTPRRTSPGLSRQGAHLLASSQGAAEVPERALVALRAFRTGVPALDAFPWTLWARLTSHRLRAGMRELGGYGSSAGFAPLRAVIASHVAAARGTNCDADQVLITSGAQQGLTLIAHLLLDAGDAVWVEDPGYPRARAVFAAAGGRIVPVPVDAEGMNVHASEHEAPAARLAYVTPSHQYPTGAVMSAARRLALLRWAVRANAWVVEDDYDSTFRYASRPLASLHGLATDQRVIYVGTFSKTLFPSLRLGYLVVPPDLVDAFTAMRAVADRHSPSVDQAVLAEFIEFGHYARHVRRMRMLYLERRDALLRSAPPLLGDRLELASGDAGMHVMGHLPPGVDDRMVSARALAHGVEAPALSRYALRPLGRGGLLLGFAAFSPRAIRVALRRLALALA